jgi:hypothetical protein
MPYYIDNLDDVLAVAGSSSFEGGQVSGITPNLIANNQASELVNMTIAPSGNLETRLGIETMSTNVSGGTNKTVQGMFYFDTPSLERLVVATDAKLYYNTSASTFATTSGTMVDAVAQVEFAQLNNKLFFTDGTSNLQFTDGTTAYRQGTSVLSITVTNDGSAYTSTPTVTIAAPDLAYGTTASATASVVANKVSAITVTNAGSGYITAPAVTISGGGGSGATATASISALAPSGFRLIKSFTNRLFAVGSGTNRNTLYASDILDTEVWKTTNSIIVGGDDGEDIVAIQPFYDYEVLVFKPSRIYLVAADPTATTAAGWTVRLLNDKIGCVAGRSVSFVNKDVFFLSNDGIRTVARSVADDFYIVGTPLSEPIKDIISRINRNYITTCNGAFHDNRYFLSVPLDTATAPNYVIVYNALFNSFEGLWSFSAARMVFTNFSSGFTTNGMKLAIGSTTGAVGQSMEYKDELIVDPDTDYMDHGTAYESYAVTKAYDFDDRISQKYGSHYEVEFYNSGSTNATISMKRATDSNYTDLATGLDTRSPGGLTLPFTLPATLSSESVKFFASSLRSYQKWRNMKFKIYSPSRKLSIRSVLAAANPDTIEVQKNIS